MQRLAPRSSVRIVFAAALLVVVAVAVGSVLALRAAPSTADLAARVAAFAAGHGVRPVPLSRISLLVREAVVATEDERFFRDRGVDVIGVLRAAPYDLRHLSFAQGASTITEQLGKLLYLGGSDHSLSGKTKEVALGYELGRHYSRSAILDDYLNTVYLGDGQYGVENASRRYFGRSAAQLTLGQASLLVGLVQAPSQYDPRVHPAAARRRQIDVLRSMVRNGYVSPDQATVVASQPLGLAGGAELPGVSGLAFARGDAFDRVQLAGGAILLLLAIGLLVLPRTGRRGRVLRLARPAAVILVLAAALVAAHAVQVA